MEGAHAVAQVRRGRRHVVAGVGDDPAVDQTHVHHARPLVDARMKDDVGAAHRDVPSGDRVRGVDVLAVDDPEGDTVPGRRARVDAGGHVLRRACVRRVDDSEPRPSLTGRGGDALDPGDEAALGVVTPAIGPHRRIDVRIGRALDHARFDDTLGLSGHDEEARRVRRLGRDGPGGRHPREDHPVGGGARMVAVFARPASKVEPLLVGRIDEDRPRDAGGVVDHDHAVQGDTRGRERAESVEQALGRFVAVAEHQQSVDGLAVGLRGRDGGHQDAGVDGDLADLATDAVVHRGTADLNQIVQPAGRLELLAEDTPLLRREVHPDARAHRIDAEEVETVGPPDRADARVDRAVLDHHEDAVGQEHGVLHVGRDETRRQPHGVREVAIHHHRIADARHDSGGLVGVPRERRVAVRRQVGRRIGARAQRERIDVGIGPERSEVADPRADQTPGLDDEPRLVPRGARVGVADVAERREEGLARCETQVATPGDGGADGVLRADRLTAVVVGGEGLKVGPVVPVDETRGVVGRGRGGDVLRVDEAIGQELDERCSGCVREAALRAGRRRRADHRLVGPRCVVQHEDLEIARAGLAARIAADRAGPDRATARLVDREAHALGPLPHIAHAVLVQVHRCRLASVARAVHGPHGELIRLSRQEAEAEAGRLVDELAVDRTPRSNPDAVVLVALLLEEHEVGVERRVVRVPQPHLHGLASDLGVGGQQVRGDGVGAVLVDLDTGGR